MLKLLMYVAMILTINIFTFDFFAYAFIAALVFAVASNLASKFGYV
jgi:hypothetical protein